MELPLAPAMQEMAPCQTFIIDEYGVLPNVGENVVIDDQDAAFVLNGVRASVRIFVGDKQKYDYLDVTDVSSRPWYDAETDKIGNFALIRWSRNLRGDFRAVSVLPIIPGREYTFGRPESNTGGKYPVPNTVDSKHVTIGIEADSYKLCIGNHNHRRRTAVWNMGIGYNQMTEPLTLLSRDAVPYPDSVSGKKKY